MYNSTDIAKRHVVDLNCYIKAWWYIWFCIIWFRLNLYLLFSLAFVSNSPDIAERQVVAFNYCCRHRVCDTECVSQCLCHRGGHSDTLRGNAHFAICHFRTKLVGEIYSNCISTCLRAFLSFLRPHVWNVAHILVFVSVEGNFCMFSTVKDLEGGGRLFVICQFEPPTLFGQSWADTQYRNKWR